MNIKQLWNKCSSAIREKCVIFVDWSSASGNPFLHLQRRYIPLSLLFVPSNRIPVSFRLSRATEVFCVPIANIYVYNACLYTRLFSALIRVFIMSLDTRMSIYNLTVSWLPPWQEFGPKTGLRSWNAFHLAISYGLPF